MSKLTGKIAHLQSWFFYLHLPWVVKGDREWELWPVHNTFSASYSSLRSSRAPAWRHLCRYWPDIISILLILGCNSNTGCSISGTNCSYVDTPWALIPTKKSAPAWTPFHRLYLQPKTYSCGDSPQSASSSRIHPLLHLDLLHGSTWRFAPCGAHGLQRDSLLLYEPLLRCRDLLLSG